MKHCPHCKAQIGARTITCKYCKNTIEKKRKIEISELPSLDEIINNSIKGNESPKKNTQQIEVQKQPPITADTGKKKKSGFEREDKITVVKGKYIHYFKDYPIYPIKFVLSWKITPEYFSTFIKNNKLEINEVYIEPYREYFIKIEDRSITDEDLDIYLSSFSLDEILAIKPELLVLHIKNNFSLTKCTWNWVFESQVYIDWLKRPPYLRISLRELKLLGMKYAASRCGDDVKFFYQTSHFFK